jgi:hypothetical protein
VESASAPKNSDFSKVGKITLKWSSLFYTILELSSSEIAKDRYFLKLSKLTQYEQNINFKLFTDKYFKTVYFLAKDVKNTYFRPNWNWS